MEKKAIKRIVSADTKRPDRVPPGQKAIERLPVLTHGEIPPVDLKRWNFRIFGLVEKEVVLTYEQFMSLPKVEVFADFHCVTRWSRLGNLWEGVAWSEILRLVKPSPVAQYLMLHSEGDYTANVSLADMNRDDVLFAYKLDGKDIISGHGWPLRAVVPGLYAWKSAKWVRGAEFMDKDRPGFWEMNGYHIHGDPWKQERYSR